MKTKALLYQIFLLTLFVPFFCSCDGDENDDEPIDPNKGTVSDVEGNIYATIKIGEQWWMAENLKTTKFTNDVAINNVAGPNDWITLEEAGYCNSGNDPEKAETYGRLYNWHAAVSGQKLCPTGWHVPNDTDWETLITFLGGNNVAGGKLKQTGTDLWNGPNTGATNESGFNAIPGGVRSGNTGDFAGIGSTCNWWSTSVQNTDNAFALGVTSAIAAVIHFNLDKNTGLAVRCVKD